MRIRIYRRGRAFAGIGAIVALLALVGTQLGYQPAATAPARQVGPMGNTGIGTTGGTGQGAGVSSTRAGNGIIVGQSYRNDVSPPLREIPAILPSSKPGVHVSNDHLELIPLVGHKDVPDQVAQTSFGANGALIAPNMPAASVSFEGINSAGGCNGCAPPDTNGEVGQTQYVQTVNSSFAVWNKTGGQLLTPRQINTIWSGFGGACQTRNDGDPVVIYDQFANRWVISQFTAVSPYDECVAVSTTNDATGTWNRYAFQLSTTDFPDYPKLSVWPDGYYMSVNWFTGGQTYAGPRPYVFNRTNMLSGAAATFQTTSAALGSSHSPMLPADLDGSLQPAAGTPNYFVEFGSSLGLWKFHTDWTTPSNTTFTNAANLAAAGFTQHCSATQNCVPQSGTTQKLDGLADRLMHRLAYRKFADGHESMVLNHSVQSGSVAGVRWYEIRNPSTSPTIYQQGTYQPDSTWRWMGSVAMDQSGDMALGYSVSSSTIDPGIRYTGRLAGDALGTLPQGETTLLSGTGFQSGVNRWGDYSAMTVDPTDDCTFWYTQEYNNSGAWAWGTHIGAFKFSTCGGAPPPTATNTPLAGPTSTPTNTPTKTPTPVAGATNTPVPTATNTPTPPPSTCGETLTNGGFESGPPPTAWSETSTGGYEIVDPTRPHTGLYSAYLNGYNSGTDSIYQSVSIPSTATSATLTYWTYISTQEACCTAYDFLKAQVLNSSGTVLATLQTLSNASPNGVWAKSSYSLLAYKGQTVRIRFIGTNDVSLPTDFFVDDVSLNVCH